MLHKKGYLSNLHSCIRHLGNQHYNHKRKVQHSLDKTRLDHKMVNRRGRGLKKEKKKFAKLYKDKALLKNMAKKKEKKNTCAISSVTLISSETTTNIRSFSVGTQGVWITVV